MYVRKYVLILFHVFQESYTQPNISIYIAHCTPWFTYKTDINIPLNVFCYLLYHVLIFVFFLWWGSWLDNTPLTCFNATNDGKIKALSKNQNKNVFNEKVIDLLLFPSFRLTPSLRRVSSSRPRWRTTHRSMWVDHSKTWTNSTITKR